MITKRNNEIWAIGGGKGGTGKSFLLSNLGTFLANSGKKVTLIDLDLGGANLHSMLGINPPNKTISDFYNLGVPLEKITTSSGIRRMSLIAGNSLSFAPQSIIYSRKLKLLRHIQKLNSDYTLIDLGAGCDHSILDTFLIADKMIVAINPELISIENVYQFIKSVIFRKLRQVLTAEGLKDLVLKILYQKDSRYLKNLNGLMDFLKKESPDIGEMLDKEFSKFKFYLILNKVHSSEDAQIGFQIKSVCLKHLGISTRYAGYIELDDSIKRSVRIGKPYLISYPTSSHTTALRQVAKNLQSDQDLRI